MLENFFLTVNMWMTGETALAGIGCFLWGMISVLFSPCHLASIPLIVAYVAGQENVVDPHRAGGYAAAFTLGLFITIAVIGIICAWLGRMLGDVGLWWQVLVGAVLIWVALDMLGVQVCSVSRVRSDWGWPMEYCPVHAPSVSSPRFWPSLPCNRK